MMKTGFLFIIICFVYSGLSAQDPGDYYSYCRKMDACFGNLQLITPDTIKVQGFKDYQHWKEFWENRINNTGEVKGDLDTYGEKMLEAYDNQVFRPDSSSEWNWNYMGPDHLTTHNRGIISSLYVNPLNIDEIYAGSNSAGMFRTLNEGKNWECVTDNLDLPAMGINDIAVDPGHPEVMYIALNPLYRSGPAFIYKTEDNCQSWKRVFSAPSDKKTAIRVIIHPIQPSILFATFTDVVYRSMDAGSTWTKIFDGLTYQPSWYQDRKLLVELEFKPGNPDFLIIGSTGIRNHSEPEASGEIWFTEHATADSVTWTRINTGLPEYCDRYAISTTTADPDHLYIGYSVGTGSFKAKFCIDQIDLDSLNVNHLFEKEWWQNYASAFSGMGYWCNGMEFSPADPDLLFVGGYSLQTVNLKTKEYAFYRFGLKDSNTHVDQRVFKVIRFNNKTCLFSGNDGGVTCFEAESGTFRSCNGEGLNNLQFYKIGHSETNPDFLIGGTQDNGILGNADGNWNSTTLGDAYEVMVDPFTANRVYVAATGGSKFIACSVNQGKSFFNTPQPFATGGLNNRPFLISPQNNRVLFIGYNEIYKTENQGLSWTRISDFQNPSIGWNCGDAIGAIGLSEADEDEIYAGFTNPTWGNGSARLLRTSDGGQTWTDLTGSLASVIYDKGITGITVSPFDPGKCWVSFNGYAQDNTGISLKKVMYSEDHGITWSDISASLPDLPVNCITGIQGDSSYSILAGNDLGIFLYDAQNHHWENISNGLPKTLVTDIEVNRTYGYLMAGTFGRGIWRSPIPEKLQGGKIPSQLSRQVDEIKMHTTEHTLRITIPEGYSLTEAWIMVYDCSGKIISKQEAGSHNPDMDISRFAPGLYILQFVNMEVSISGKLIKS